MVLASISIALSGSLALFILLFLVCIGLTILFYRYTLPPLPTSRRIALSVFRGIALTLLLLMMFEPVFRFVSTNEQPPTVAILIDDSQSMTIRDGSGDRAATVRQFLQAKPFSGLPSGVRVKYFTFSSKLIATPTTVPDSILFKGEITNLSDVLAQLKDQVTKENIQAVALISDGNYTAGKNPLYDAQAVAIPISAVGVGDTTEQKDVLVTRVITNNLAYAETRVPVDVTIKSSGYSGDNVEVTVAEGSTVLDRKVIALKEGTQEYPVRLFVEPKEEGMKKYSVGVSKLPGELTERNNVRSFFMKVLKSKLRVMLIAGAPSPDVAAIRQALVEDQHLSVRALVQKGSNEFYDGTLTRSTVDSTDCIVFIGFPSSATTNETLKLLSLVIDQETKPILFINSKTTDYSKLQTFAPLLPFMWSGVSTGEVSVFPSVVERQKNNPLITLEGSASADGWQQLPPIYKTQTVFRTKPEADVIAAVKIQNIVLTEPLIATRNINRRKSFAITGHGVWRWRLLAQNNPSTEKIFPLLMTNAVRWLTTKEEDKNVRVVSTKESFTTAEPIEFTGQVYDDQLHPVDNAEMRVELSRGNEKFQIALNAVGNGRYEGSLEGVGEGDYTFTVKATADGKVYGEDRGKFSVGQMNVEFLETKMNKQLLEQMAFQTGGKYYDIANTRELKNGLVSGRKLEPKELVQSSEIELWNWKYLAAIVILLFALEWFLRKRSGML
ncbi:MAG: hypothetical protein HYR76_09300 [Ignavibacteria bacterium]|nr:hypothetical protein [Ignavibacteria bacterium]MBI3766853.1 hypothetical protein [Ignavibacteriales bacterium]